MGRPRTATSILDARGAFKTHPERKRVEPEAKNFPVDPPETLNELEKKHWHEIVEKIPAGILKDADVFSVEIMVKLFTEFRLDFEGMSVGRLTRLSAELGKFGLSPSDRAKLSIDKPKENDFDDF